MKPQASTKKLLVDKTNSMIVVITAIAAFIVVFSLIATKTLITQAAYQNRVISAKKIAVNQLKTDIQASDNLVVSYKAFVGTPQNIISGASIGSGAQDGDNAKVVLDALPSKYDFPALATSIEKLLTNQSLQVQSITGTDEEVAQSSNQSSTNPSPIAMPFQITVAGNYTAIQSLISSFGSSIRPFQIQTIQLSGNQSNMTLNLTVQTYYQPEKIFSITKKVVR